MAKNENPSAAEKVAAAEKSKENKPAKEGSAFSRAGKAIKKFFKDLKGEIKKIVWPDGKTVVKSTVVVLFAVFICGLAIFGVDQLLALALQGLKAIAQKLAENKEAAETTATNVAAMISNGSFFLG